MLKEQRDTCIFQLEERLDRDSMEECRNFIKIKRKSRHYKTLEQQRNKLERLCQRKKSAKSAKSGCSNIQDSNQNNTANNNTNWQRIGTATPSQYQYKEATSGGSETSSAPPARSTDKIIKS